MPATIVIGAITIKVYVCSTGVNQRQRAFAGLNNIHMIDSTWVLRIDLHMFFGFAGISFIYRKSAKLVYSIEIYDLCSAFCRNLNRYGISACVPRTNVRATVVKFQLAWLVGRCPRLG